MRMPKFPIRVSIAFVVAILSSLTPSYMSICRAEEVPDYMNVIVGNGAPMSKTEAAEQNLLALDLAMFPIYDTAQAKFQKNFLAEHPVVMALFSNQGGKLTLFRPGKPPLEAPHVPIRYQVYKSVGHSTRC